MNRRAWLQLSSFSTVATFAGCGGSKVPEIDQETYAEEITAVIKQHAEICSAAYKSAWQTADSLRAKANVFLTTPTSATHAALQDAWIVAHNAYMETEGLRGQGTPADGVHSNIASWPVDPTALDTVPGNLKTGVVHDTKGMPTIDAQAIRLAHQPRENKVLMGFHAIEFLIYGFDQYDDAPGPRVFTDYTAVLGVKRRRELLSLLTQLLPIDLAVMNEAWHPSEQGNYRAQFMEKDPKSALTTIFTGLVTVCNNGLSGALLRPLASGDQKDEICQFSDTSLDAVRHAIIGLQKTLTGKAPGRVVADDEVPLLGLIAKADASIAKEIESGFEQMIDKLKPLNEPFDQLIKPGHSGRKALEEVADGLSDQAKLLVQVGKAVGAKLGSLA
ncbi:MAG: hypothetical protein GWQ05_28545 [Verrucomicrobiaceae bacterium]|nr:hypothetical protein [Verrucomicrobiaceae bacterium]NCF94876.1 hypothetical protein [Verrucomicrobiaceae bacterium]